MSTLNLGLQTVGLMRQKGSDKFESIANHCKKLADFRNVAKSNLELPSQVVDSVTPCKILLANVFSRLTFKKKNVSVCTSATLEEINDHLSVLHNIEPNLQLDQPLRKGSLAHLPKAFLDHCCTRKQYIFEIKKCGIANCTTCRPVLRCEDCNMWRLLYSKYKLDAHEKQKLEMALEGMSYTCGSMIQDLGLTDRLSDVYVCDHRCSDLIETLLQSKLRPYMYILW